MGLATLSEADFVIEAPGMGVRVQVGVAVQVRLGVGLKVAVQVWVQDGVAVKVPVEVWVAVQLEVGVLD